MTTHNRTSPQSASDQIRDKAKDIKQNLQDMGSVARDAVSEQATQLRDAASERAADLRTAATERAEQWRDTAGEYYEKGRERAMSLEQTLEDKVREKPLQALLMAAGLGVLVGMCWTRR